MRTTLVRLAVLAALVLGGLFAAPGQAQASAGACGGAQCTWVQGSGSYVQYVESRYGGSTRFPYYDRGHVQVRWHAGGVDHTKNSPEGGWSNMYPVRVNLNVTVDANTYVCSRFWRWNGSRWILPWGDYVCVRTHP